ncbi:MULTISPECIES: HNH endonuclease [unclassified Streptomyces]|uniref:HNH endonuclease n=1 Tax=unclassified Streptomyces TaxID=2593676 RepID=UPI0036B8D42B
MPLRQNKKTVITDRRLAPVNIKRKELVARLLAGRCEACGRVDEVEVHHVGKLADLGKPGKNRPPWTDLMAARHRKALVVCGSCHADIHGKKSVPALTE